MRHALIDDNVLLLQQGIELLGRLDVGQYTAVDPGTKSGLGGHFRHILDHYGCFLAGAERGVVDYEGRSRDPRVETILAEAVAKAGEIIAALEAWEGRNLTEPARVRLDGFTAEGENEWSLSSLERELQFLVSHTVHHYALIGYILKARGMKLDEDFGVAPSTLRYRRRLAACAPVAG
jgi:hypothetical protein